MWLAISRFPCVSAYSQKITTLVLHYNLRCMVIKDSIFPNNTAEIQWHFTFHHSHNRWLTWWEGDWIGSSSRITDPSDQHGTAWTPYPMADEWCGTQPEVIQAINSGTRGGIKWYNLTFLCSVYDELTCIWTYLRIKINNHIRNILCKHIHS